MRLPVYCPRPWGATLRLLVLALVMTLVMGCSENDRPLDSPVRLEGNIFGSFYQVTIADPLTQGEARRLEEGFVAALQEVDASMSIYRDDSELMIFNQSPLEEWQPLSDALIEVLALSRTVHEESGGAFDPTVGALVNLWSFGAEARPEEVPAEDTLQARLAEVGFEHVEIDVENLQARRLRDVLVDLGGVAKGHGTDRVAAYLDSQGIEHYLVNLGGDLIVKGFRDGDEDPWRIGIEAPLEDRQEARHIVPLPEISMATSGDYRNYFEQDGKRFSHTLDPRTGRPITHRLASVTVAHSSNAWADAWATALMVLGEERGMALAREHALKVLMIVRDGDEWVSIASPAFIELFGESLIDDLGLQTVESSSL